MRAIGAELLAQRHVQPEVQEGIDAAGLHRKVFRQRRLLLQQLVIFRVLENQLGQLRLEGLQRQLCTPPAPGFTVGGTQLLATVVGEQAHAGVFSANSHQRAIGQRGHSGRRALQM
jgi:hypothetical protein